MHNRLFENMDDKEDKIMAYCCKSQLNNTNGCEGCINFRLNRGCTFEGFNFYKYSKEEECDECEQKSHPKRFEGCLFCRSPIHCYDDKLFDVCIDCGAGFREFMFETFGKFIDKECMMGQGSYRLCSSSTIIEKGYYDIRDKKRLGLVPDFSNRFGEWKGFVSKYEDGKYTHTIPEFTEEQIQKIVQEDYRVITWDNIDEILLSYIIKLNINLYEPVQINK